MLEGLEYTVDRSLAHRMSPFVALSGQHEAGFASSRGNDRRACRRMTNRLDAMTVGIQHEGTVIVGVISRSKSGRAVVAPSRRERGRVKSVNGRAIGSTKADMCAGNWCSHLSFAGDGEFNTDRPRCGAIIGTTALAEINDALRDQVDAALRRRSSDYDQCR